MKILKIIPICFLLLGAFTLNAQIFELEEEDISIEEPDVPCVEIQFISVPVFEIDHILIEWDDVVETEYLITISYPETSGFNSYVEDEPVLGEDGTVSFDWYPEHEVSYYDIEIKHFCEETTVIYMQRINETTGVTMEHIMNPGISGVGVPGFTSCANYHCSNEADIFVFYSGLRVEAFSKLDLCQFGGFSAGNSSISVHQVLNNLRDGGTQLSMRRGNYSNVQSGCQVFSTAKMAEHKAIESDIYPNPTSDILKLSIDLPQVSEISISLYNQLGVCSKSLVRELKLADGAHQLKFDVADLPAGIYYVKIHSDDASLINKTISFIKLD